MSTAIAIAIASEVVTLFNAASDARAFGANTFLAARKYAPLMDRNALANLTVSVVADSPALEDQSRNRFDFSYPIDIAVQKALTNPESVSEIDPLSLLLEQLYFYALDDDANGNSRRILPTSKAALVDVAYKTLCDPKHLKELQIYTGVITLTYKLSTVIR